MLVDAEEVEGLAFEAAELDANVVAAEGIGELAIPGIKSPRGSSLVTVFSKTLASLTTGGSQFLGA